jgi:hypothetical protein
MNGERLYVLCEGPDDERVLRELARRQFSCDKPDDIPERSWHTVLRNDHWERIDIRPVDGRDALRQQAINLIELQKYEERITCLCISFDPDGDVESTWRKTLFESIEIEGYETTEREGIYVVKSLDSWQETTVVPLPWIAETPIFDDLPDQQNLERVLVGALHVAFPERSQVIEGWLNDVSARGWGQNWKTAAKLWHAVAYPKAELCTKVAGQDDVVGAKLVELLQGTLLWSGLARAFTPSCESD